MRTYHCDPQTIRTSGRSVNIDQEIIRNGQRQQHPRKVSQAALLLPSTTHSIPSFRQANPSHPSQKIA